MYLSHFRLSIVQSCNIHSRISSNLSPPQPLVRSLATNFASSGKSTNSWSHRLTIIIIVIIMISYRIIILHCKPDILINQHYHHARTTNGMRDVSYFTTCQAFLPLSLAFGLTLTCGLACGANALLLLFVITAAGTSDFQCVSDNCT